MMAMEETLKIIFVGSNEVESLAINQTFKMTDETMQLSAGRECPEAMSNDKLPYVSVDITHAIQGINETCSEEEDSFRGSLFNITTGEQQDSDRGGKCHQEIMIFGGQQHTNLAEKSISCHMFKQLEILQRLTNSINQQLIYLPQLLDKIVQEVCNVIDDAQFCFIALHNPQTQQLELNAKAGIDVDKLFLLKLSGDIEGRDAWSRREASICDRVPAHTKSNSLYQVFATGIPQLFQGSKNTEESIVKDCPVFLHPCFSMFSYFNPSSMYAVAIESAQAGRLGVLVIGNWEDTHAFDVTSQKLLDAVVDVVAIAINNARMDRAFKEQEEHLARQTAILLEQTRELEKNRHQIQLQNLQLSEAAKLKSQFLATTSHELRTPLNVILGLSQVMLRQRNSTLSEQQIDMLQRILSNGNQLLEVLEDMLYFTTVEAGCLSLQVEEFNLATLVLTTVAEHHSVAEKKLLNLQVDINLVHPFVVNDSNRLKQVLVKLLLNAIKFTETGGIAVKLWEISRDRIAIAVEDSGIGIAESDLEYIFEQFRQVDQTTTRKYSGTGLGLAITKSLVEIMQGTISVTSKLREGSTFCVELPRTIEVTN
ncbi:ATP-binding protein [Dendronalium sp. ChiSLP03b]|uniref:GAF domain-containing sensor histidine kinase n=1 Tax=Dendronalium sp. ChiSLP03b TaxID=3075381 RepID=UPI002AD3D360|nr:ATP-binding protein [Dendronalium sp. ChiSLP03b]MDZ8206338.1 ATP-binding protein [Dendronalium sp. ChiSLP03b]